MNDAAKTVGYQYVVVRLVPSIEREEFLNIGVVVYSQMADFLDAGIWLDRERITAFAPGVHFEDLQAAADALLATVRGIPCPGRLCPEKLGQRFGWVSAPRSTILQPGPMHGGITSDPQQTLNSLLQRLVLPARTS